MNFLIVCTYFPPDSTIAAVRPYMFAKYLSLAGHNVTILRSGDLYNTPDQSYGDYSKLFKVITYLGEDSPAERFERGKQKERLYNKAGKTIAKEKTKFLIKPILKPLQAINRIRKAKHNFNLLKKQVNKMVGSRYDIVFSTFGNMENIWGGIYAAKVFQTKLIMDFRDPVVWYHAPKEVLWNMYAARVQKKALLNADVSTAVSNGLAEKLREMCPDATIYTLYNGFEPSEEKRQKVSSTIFTVCYTGSFHELSNRALADLLNCISEMIRDNQIHTKDLRFIYAGPDSENVKDWFGKFKLEAILDDRGYVTKQETNEIQNLADVFLVLSWNTKQSQGILTGKFYEGIRAGKPILSMVAGEEPNSELMELNRKYHYGYCFEEANPESSEGLKLFLLNLIHEKKEKETIEYPFNQELASAFRYDTTTQRLISIAETMQTRKHRVLDQ